MTTTYELYTNENGTPKAVEGKAPAILERVETLETDVETIEETLGKGVVTSVNGKTGAVTGLVTSVNGTPADASGNVTIDAGIPVGSVIAFAGNSTPEGYLLCNGGAVSRTTYADLFAKIGTTYGSGNGASTFNLPNLTDKFIQGSGTAGTVKSAGLPNIEGTFKSVLANTSRTTTGAFTESKVGEVGKQGSAIFAHYVTLGMNASKSNSIYGASTTVQPPALTMRMYIKY